MRAGSLLGTVSELESVCRSLHSKKRLSYQLNEAIERVQALVESICCQCDGVISIFPDASYKTTNSEIVADVAERVYQGCSLRSGDVKHNLASSDRIEVIDGWVIIPLSNQYPAVHNWPQVLGLLADKLWLISDLCQNLSKRVDVDESPQSRELSKLLDFYSSSIEGLGNRFDFLVSRSFIDYKKVKIPNPRDNELKSAEPNNSQ